MKQNTGKFISTLLALCMVLAMLPVTALAEDPPEDPPQEVTYPVDGGNLRLKMETLTLADTGSVKGYVVKECGKNVTRAVIPGNINGVIVLWIDRGAFENCSKLTSVTLPEGIEFGEGAFQGCSSLTSVTIPDRTTWIPQDAFRGCSSLASVIFSDSVINIGDRAFYGCSSLTSVTIPSSVIRIGRDDALFGLVDTFGECYSLTSFEVESENPNFASEDGVLFNKDKTALLCFPKGKGGAYTIPNGVESLKNAAFSGCTGLTSLTIPDSVTHIDFWVFSECSNIKDIFYGGSEENWNKMNIDYETNAGLYTATIHYNSTGNGSDAPQDGSYRISFDTGVASVAVSPMLTNSNGKLSSLPNPSLNGYKFDGWFTARDGGEKITTETIFRRDTTVYAHWTRNTSSSEGTISNGSSSGGGGSKGKPSVKPGAAASKPAAPSTPATPSSSASSSFSDVPAGTWYAEAVNYAVTRGIMNGTGSGSFSPDGTTTRAMLMTMLARLNGVDTEGGSNWYEKSMQWAAENGISDGSNPNGPITREQLVTMLYRYQGSPAAEGSLDAFADGGMVNDWAVDAMRWAVANGIIQGSNGSVNPAASATRAEVAAILMRFCEQFSV